MFRPERMARLDAVLLKKDLRRTLLRLGAAASMELDEPATPGIPARSGGDRDRAACAALAARASDLRKSLAVTAVESGQTPEMGFDPAAAALAELESAATARLKRRDELSARYEGLARDDEKLSPYSGLPLPSECPRKFAFLYCATGEIPSGNLAGLRAKMPANAVILPLAGGNGSVRAAVLGSASDGPELSGALKLAGFRHEELPARPGFTLAALAASLASESRLAKAELKSAELEVQELAAEAARRLPSIERAAALEGKLAGARDRLGSTGTSAVISGWVPAGEAEGLARAMGEASGGLCVAEISAPPAGSSVPVLLRPPGILRPFAMLVSSYGLPGYGEVEPTVFAAAAYLFMFGMMFGDAGHGLVLCAAGFAMALKGRSEKIRDSGRMVFACGVSAALFGILYGGFFGLERLKKFALWRDPLAGDPLGLVTAALAAGAVIISIGVVLNIANRALAGDRLGAVLGRFGAAGLVFYWGGIALAAGFAGARLALPLMALAVFCWVLKEPALYLLRSRSGSPPGEDGFAAVSAEALVGAFEAALLYLANTVSFVRLAAYAMSHAALMSAAYALAGTADGVWGRGSLAGIAAAAAGNLAAIGLEGLVAAVQALRLEYYEFFGKFFEGGGRPFKPFSLTGG